MTNAVDWAESSLGLSQLWKEIQTAQSNLDDLATHLDKAQDDKRMLAEAVTDREADLYLEERAKHAEQSATWLDKHMVAQKRKDPKLITLRRDYIAAQSTLSGLEYDWEVQKSQVKILTARMVQLGGYLNFLAAAKQAETLTKNQELTKNPKTEKTT